jgi:hypothetical protein
MSVIMVSTKVSSGSISLYYKAGVLPQAIGPPKSSNRLVVININDAIFNTIKSKSKVRI